MKIRWLPGAIRDRHAQIDYIAERNPHAALDQLERIGNQVKDLKKHPEIGRPGRIKRTRELVISGTPFVIIYRYKKATHEVELISLLDGAQKWPVSKKR